MKKKIDYADRNGIKYKWCSGIPCLQIGKPETWAYTG